MKTASAVTAADATTSPGKEPAMSDIDNTRRLYVNNHQVIRDPEISVTYSDNTGTPRIHIHMGTFYMSMEVTTGTELRDAITAATNLSPVNA
jgi:hypothetical protein